MVVVKGSIRLRIRVGGAILGLDCEEEVTCVGIDGICGDCSGDIEAGGVQS